MRLATRKLLDRAFTGSGILAIALMAVALVILLAPIFSRGCGAIVFTATVEHRRLMLEKFERGDRAEIEAEIQAARAAGEPLYRMIADFERQLEVGDAAQRRPRTASGQRDERPVGAHIRNDEVAALGDGA